MEESFLEEALDLSFDRLLMMMMIYKKGKVHLCTGTQALYRPYDPYEE